MSSPRTNDGARKRRRVLRLQRWLLNPPMRLLVWLGLVPGHVIVETVGRRTGRRRRTVVGAHRDGERLWIIAEQGRHAGWVCNLEAHPEIRVRRGLRWRPATAAIIDEDDPTQRLRTWGRPGHAQLVQRLGTNLTTIQLTDAG